VPIDGSAAAVQLSDALVTGGDIQQDFAFTPDSQRVLYRADRDEDELVELFSARADGSAPPVEISGALVEDGDVRSFQATPDGQRAVYVADQEVDERPWLYVARVDGSAAPVRIGGALSTAQALDFEIHPASTSVVFRTREGIEPPALLVADLAGGPALELSGGWVDSAYALSPDGRWVVFQAEGLFARPIDASRPAVRLSHNGANFAFLPGGRTMVFRASVAGQRVNELYRVSLGGTGLVKLSGELATGDVIGDVSGFRLEDSGKQLVYDVDGSTLDTPIVCDEAFVLDLRPQQAPLALFPGDTGETDIFQYSLSPDRSRLVYSAGNDPAETSDLFSIPLDGETPGVRFTQQEGWSGILRFVTTPDSRSVVYLRWQGTHQLAHLFHVDIDRITDPVELNGPLVEGGEVRDFRSARTARASCTWPTSTRWEAWSSSGAS
jgi:Tol biopolymer transport system component